MQELPLQLQCLGRRYEAGEWTSGVVLVGMVRLTVVEVEQRR